MFKRPLKFQPILKSKIWGGKKLKEFLYKDSKTSDIGESWEISDVDDDISVVSKGDFIGKSLYDLITEYKGLLVGEKVYKTFGDKFPLLVKFIDAGKPLSIQLHPDDELAKKRHNSFGKTEMWYVVQSDPGGKLIVGFNQEMNKEKYLKNLEQKTLPDILNFEKVKGGDVFYISTGLVHAVGAGVLLAEIQQTSDITYRIYDWDRKDKQGNYRELHTEYALDAIDYSYRDTYKTSYTKELNKRSKIIQCQYFTTNIISLNKEVKIDNSDKDSFVIYMCVKGRALFQTPDEHLEIIKKGETVLIPASIKKYNLFPVGYAELLEIYI